MGPAHGYSLGAASSPTTRGVQQKHTMRRRVRARQDECTTRSTPTLVETARASALQPARAQALFCTSSNPTPPPVPPTPGPCAAARTLRQHTESITGSSIDKSHQTFAQTLWAQARSQAGQVAIGSNEVSLAAISSKHYPGSQTSAATPDINYKSEQLGAEVPIAATGTAAVSTTDMGAVAVAASEARIMATKNTNSVSQWQTYAPARMNSDAVMGQPNTASVGANLVPNGALATSDQGDGPNAVSAAGMAVASAYAGNAAHVANYPMSV
jgi:hypothetical protein